jgi:hypothetical protein
MKKSVRINLLVITTVLAIFVFAGVWYLRPSVSNEVLDIARQRQLQPLLEIGEPMRLSSKAVDEKVSTSAIDQKALAQQLLPSLKDELSLSLEDDLYKKLKDRFASDEQILATLVDKLEPLMVEKLTPSMQRAFDTYRETFSDEEVSSSLAAFKNSIQKEFDVRFSGLKAEIINGAGGQLEEQVSLLKQDLSKELVAYVPQLVDLLLPQVVEGVYKDLNDNKATYLPYFAEELKPYLSQPIDEQQLVALYGTYRDRIVADLVPSILDSLEVPAKGMVDSMVKTVTPSPVVTKPSVTSVGVTVPAVPSAPKAKTVVEKVAVAATSTTAVTATPVAPVTVATAPVTTVVPVAPATVAEVAVAPVVPATPAAPAPVAEVAVAPVVPVAPPIPVLAVMEPVVPKAPAVVETVPVVPSAPSFLSVVAKPKVQLPLVSAPIFLEEEPVVFIEPAEYDLKREAIRNQAIQAVLDRLNSLE